ncbi:hypothetical protein JXC34_00540 [Candidatus Woesearchaeota archaeon]|nr:hypothetical protein [Candidatus Woesearchaeota archaeon]
MRDKELTRRYIAEGFPRKPYVKKKRVYIRDRKQFEIFFHEILVVLFIIFMIYMVFTNYVHNQNYAAGAIPEEEKVAEIDVDINKDTGSNNAPYIPDSNSPPDIPQP